ncbi:hypothetical protein H6F89_18325 [Cyanobacteria bacterium FACHB-63]|nr:hypothetical protein [Cyanobacteria bacterium FACHB-63]
MSSRELIASLHVGIQQLQEQYPDRWRVMLDAIVENPDGIFSDLAKLQAPATPAARPAFTPDFSQE